MMRVSAHAARAADPAHRIPAPVRQDPLATLFAALVGVFAGIVQSTFFEWAYHRYWLHRPWLPPHMFTAHTLVHHQLCKHDDTYHVHDEEQEEALTFQWWAGPGLVGLNLLPWFGAWWALGARIAPFHPGVVIAGIGVTIFAYYLAYEGFHFLMHKPSVPWIERSRVFRFMDKHHRIHHSHMGRNFNVVFPLADLILGTLMVRDPVSGRRTEPTARRTARRHSKYGRKLREQDGKMVVDPGETRMANESEARESARVTAGAGERR